MIGWVVSVWLVLLVMGLAFNYGAHRNPTPSMRVLYPVPDPEEEDGADATGPVPSP